MMPPRFHACILDRVNGDGGNAGQTLEQSEKRSRSDVTQIAEDETGIGIDD